MKSVECHSISFPPIIHLLFTPSPILLSSQRKWYWLSGKIKTNHSLYRFLWRNCMLFLIIHDYSPNKYVCLIQFPLSSCGKQRKLNWKMTPFHYILLYFFMSSFTFLWEGRPCKKRAPGELNRELNWVSEHQEEEGNNVSWRWRTSYSREQ